VPTTTREFRKFWIKEAQRRLSGMASDPDVVAHLIKEAGVSPATAQRYVGAAWKMFQRAATRRNRKAELGRALAVRDRAMRVAMKTKKFLVVANNVEERPDPDVRAYLAAADSRDKLLGLTIDEKDLSAQAAALAPIIVQLFEAFRLCISNKDELAKLVGIVRALFSSEGRIVEGQVKVIEPTSGNGRPRPPPGSPYL